MKATELRIGNWVKRDVQPDGFQIDSHSFFTCERDPEMYNPIPLTEQWLKDFGFRENNGKFFRDHPYFVGYKDWIPEGFWMLRDTEVPIRLIEYVHQLQNLYFALTGKELKS